MFEQVDGARSMQGGPVRETAPEPPRSVEGYHEGRVVQVKDFQSMIAEAAEEVSFAFSERVEKHLAERRSVRLASGQTELLQGAEDCFARLPDFEKGRQLEAFMARLWSLRDVSAGQILAVVRLSFRDVSIQYAVLLHALESTAAAGESSSGLRNALAEALEHLVREQGPAVRAGLNTSVTAFEVAGQGFAGVQRLRDFYRSAVLGFTDLDSAYRGVMDAYGEEGFQRAMDFLIRAAGAELMSRGPSIDRAELRSIIDRLYYLEVLGNMQRACTGLVKRMQTQFREPAAVSGRALMGRLLGLTIHPSVGSQEILAILNDLGIGGAAARIDLLRELRYLVWEIPFKACKDMQGRQKLLKGMQEALDSEIAKEQALQSRRGR